LCSLSLCPSSKDCPSKASRMSDISVRTSCSDQGAASRRASRSRSGGRCKDTTVHQSADAIAECAICYEAVDLLDGAVSLPCACRATFCHTCWDRALAYSITACGIARCPSCRCPVRVDFDIVLERLVFSRARVVAFRGVAGSRFRNAASVEDARHDDWQQRLYQQAKPTQIHLLRQYGGRAPVGQGRPVRPWGPWPRTTNADESESQAAEHSSRSSSPPSSSASSSDINEEEQIMMPRCICGSSLRHISVPDRVRAFVNEDVATPAPPSMVERLLASPPIFCDICDRRLGPSNWVWTCENGRRTVLHAAAYDVCEACFEFHVHGDSRSTKDYKGPWRARRKCATIRSSR
jgi:hypothetical protein